MCIRDSLESEKKYLQELFLRIRQSLDQLDSILRQDPKPNIIDLQKKLDDVRKLPIEAKEYQYGVEKRIKQAQGFANKLRSTGEVDANQAEQLLKEYNEYNIFITDGFRLQKAYEESQDLLRTLSDRLKQSTEEDPITYEEILDLTYQSDNVKFDINGELSNLKAQLFIIRVDCLREANADMIKEKEGEDVSSSTVKLQIDIPYQAPKRSTPLNFQTLKSLIIYGYLLKKKFPQNDLLRNVLDFMEYIAGKVEDFILDVYKIKDPSRLEDANTLCIGFIDCSSLVIDHKTSLEQIESGYTPVLESLIIKDEEKIQALPDPVPPFVLNARPTVSPMKSQIEIEDEEDNRKIFSVSKGKITPQDNTKKRGRPKKSDEEKRGGYPSEEVVRDKVKKKMKVESKEREKARKNMQKDIREELKRQKERELLMKKITERYLVFLREKSLLRTTQRKEEDQRSLTKKKEVVILLKKQQEIRQRRR
eukprot:TRINITY_DN1090_c0_g1_i2.p1 TRINITY_DN1090_c0_g1~~TRINITY_DN1090_c0_g1_i2.p1  ORF type:complete len:478 (-),score=132.85 TRINITY_DN1090_c0_g1_i2:148-1581(-)